MSVTVVDFEGTSGRRSTKPRSRGPSTRRVAGNDSAPGVSGNLLVGLMAITSLPNRTIPWKPGRSLKKDTQREKWLPILEKEKTLEIRVMTSDSTFEQVKWNVLGPLLGWDFAFLLSKGSRFRFGPDKSEQVNVILE
jgi:hypothetical protein